MTDNISRKDIWDSAAKAGLALGTVSIAYVLITILLPSGSQSTIGALLISAGNLLLWVAKFAGCIFLMSFFMKKFADGHPGCIGSDTFRFGAATALLSSLVFSGFYLLYVTKIAPDTFEEAFNAVSELYASVLDDNSREAMESMKGSLPVVSFFSNFIYCTLYGTVLASILSRRIPSPDPFDNIPQ